MKIKEALAGNTLSHKRTLARKNYKKEFHWTLATVLKNYKKDIEFPPKGNKATSDTVIH